EGWVGRCQRKGIPWPSWAIVCPPATAAPTTSQVRYTSSHFFRWRRSRTVCRSVTRPAWSCSRPWLLHCWWRPDILGAITATIRSSGAGETAVASSWFAADSMSACPTKSPRSPAACGESGGNWALGCYLGRRSRRQAPTCILVDPSRWASGLPMAPRLTANCTQPQASLSPTAQPFRRCRRNILRLRSWPTPTGSDVTWLRDADRMLCFSRGSQHCCGMQILMQIELGNLTQCDEREHSQHNKGQTLC